jgi:hypothetical protein
MTKYFACITAILLGFSIGSSAALAGTLEKTYSEDFDTREYCDIENTSASWDSLRGEIKLPPYEINVIGEYATPDASWGIVIEGDSAYIADGYSGVLLYDISNLDSLVYRGYYETDGEVHALDVEGNKIYVACGEKGFDIINKGYIYTVTESDEKHENIIQSSSLFPQSSALDFINPERTILGATALTSFTFDIQMVRDSLIVIASWDSVKIIKVKSLITDDLPVLIDGKDTPGGSIDFEVVDDKIFVSNHNSGLEIIDFDNCISIIGSCETPGSSYGFDIAGNYLYLADSEAGMQVIDISNPESPVIVANYDTPGYAVNVTVSDNYAYISDWDEGIVVVDISNPTVPVIAGFSSCEIGTGAINWPWDVEVTGGHALVADHSGGVKVLQITPDYAMDYYHVQSLPVNILGENVASVKLESLQEGSVSWEISADGGENWQEVNADNSWYNIITPGNILLWRSTHSYPGGMTNSSCSFLNIEWDSQVPTLLANSGISINGSYVEVNWSVSRITDEIKFVVYRSLFPDDNFEKVSVLDPGDRLEYTFRDDRCEDGATYHYCVYTLEDSEETFLFHTKPITIPAAVLSLYQNKPNPFNPVTTIKYNLSARGCVVLDVYDVSGRMIKRLVDDEQAKGPHNIIWNGKDSAGNMVSSGVYFYILKTENGQKSRKMVLLK